MKKQTIVNTDEISIYIKDLRKIPILSYQRQDEICMLISDKNITKTERNALLTELVLGNLRFVISIAKTYQNQGIDLIDLISEGNLGLMKAAERFDHTTGFRFISYAVWWIRQSIMASLNDNSRTIRIPSNLVQEKVKNGKQIKDENFIDFEGSTLPYCVGLYKEVDEDGNQLIDLIVNPDSKNPEELFDSNSTVNRKRIDLMLSVLDERERIIIEKSFGLNGVEANLDDLGEQFGCTKERIRQLREKAIKKLRNDSFDLINNL